MYFLSYSVLRLAKCVSRFEDMGPNTAFQPILPYQNLENISNSQVILLTSGKFVYDVEQILL